MTNTEKKEIFKIKYWIGDGSKGMRPATEEEIKMTLPEKTLMKDGKPFPGEIPSTGPSGFGRFEVRH